MANDLQVELLAKLGNVLSAFDKVQGKLKDLEREQAKANKTAADMQKKIVEGFNTTEVDKFQRSIKGNSRAMADFQNQAGEGMVHLKGKFEAFHGVALRVGGAASLALAGIAAAARMVSEKIDEALKKSAQLGETAGDKQTKAALAIAATPGVTDAKGLLARTQSLGGTATQDQINDFVTKLADTSRKEDEADKRQAEEEAVQDAQDNQEREKARHEGREFKPTIRKPRRQRKFFLNDQTAAEATRAYADYAALPGADEVITRSLKETGSVRQAQSILDQQLAQAETADPEGIQVLRSNRDLELRNLRAGSSHNARKQALAKRLEETRDNERAVKQAGRGGVSRIAHAITDEGGLVEDVVDIFTPGSFEQRTTEKQAEAALGNANRPIRVEVINQPPAPVDGGY